MENSHHSTPDTGFNAARFNHQSPAVQEQKRNCLARYLLTCTPANKALMLGTLKGPLRADIERRMLTEQAHMIALLSPQQQSAYWNQYNLRVLRASGPARQAMARKRSRLQQEISQMAQKQEVAL